MSDSESDQSLDQEVEDEIYLSKLDSLTNHLRQISLHISGFIRQQNVKEAARMVVISMEKALDDYNSYCFRKRSKKLLYFKIDPLAINSDQEKFIHRIDLETSPSSDWQKLKPYFINLVFMKDESNYFRMHIEIWKQDGKLISSNQALQKFEGTITHTLFTHLLQNGFVNHLDGAAIVLKSKRPNYENPNKNSNENNDLMEVIYQKTEQSFNQIIMIMIKGLPCKHCNRYMLYDSKLHIFMPPTTIIQEPKERMRLHEPCAVKFYRTKSENLRSQQGRN